MLIRTARDLGAVIRDHRRRLGLGQQTLADRIGVSRQWVVEVEKGKPRAEVGLILRALDALGVTLVLGGGFQGPTTKTAPPPTSTPSSMAPGGRADGLRTGRPDEWPTDRRSPQQPAGPAVLRL